MVEIEAQVLIGVLAGMLAPIYGLLVWLLKVVGCHGEKIAVLDNENEHHNHGAGTPSKHKSKNKSNDE